MIEMMLNRRHRLRIEISEIDRDIWEVLKKYRNKLSKKTYKVLKARLHEGKTLEEVKKEWGLTRERIRQIEYEGVIELDNLLSETA